ncbi:glycosyltransferase [Algoriphagus aquimarinus]|uniref:Glycosyltransferase family 2 protein n=1 Tax=Algoriphagus aquimarinus TaxID=237018 RepID=A0A5C7A808_9BACT|nr:glycosyltransferase [Algoriphagus aquimarinus]TXE02406.1 glycosyltransferase family 2 protein [Algoriphagus aquimarinus]
MNSLKSGISIVICTYNGESRIDLCLDHIRDSEFSGDFEVIVVDNASKDQTALKANSIIKKSGLDGRVVSENNPGLSSARWRGVMEAKFEFILFCDDDNWISTDFLKIGYDILKSHQSIGSLGSQGVPFFQGIKPDWFDDFSHSYAVGSLGKSNGPQPKGSYHYGACCFFRKSALEELVNIGFQSILTDRSGTSLSSGGDVELCLAVQLLGFELWFDDRLVFHHCIEPHRLKWSYYLKLKQGIASSFPLLDSYRIEEFSNFGEFGNFLKREFLLTSKGVLKSGLFSLFKKDKLHEVNFLTSSTKFKAYFKNRKATLKSFEINKRIFDT